MWYGFFVVRNGDWASASVQASVSEQDQDQRSLESLTRPSITAITHEVEMLTDEQKQPQLRPKDVDSRLYIVINFPTCDSRVTYPSSGLVAQLGRCKTWTLDSGLDCWTGLLDCWTGPSVYIHVN